MNLHILNFSDHFYKMIILVVIYFLKEYNAQISKRKYKLQIL